jgi:hypothetical protein
MNEKIEKLAEEAGFMEGWFSESGDDCEREIKKFAELIVRECADYANWYQTNSQYTDIAKAIREHFGVEE